MYCGEGRGTSIDHFEPIARNPPRTFDWLNHLLACTTCNSHEKRDQFPVDAQGQPLLIDPTAEDPFDHLLLTLSVGRYEWLSEKGRFTIEIFSLNRPILEQGRADARLIIEACLEKWYAASHAGDSALMGRMVRAIQGQPFADVCQSMLRQAVLPGADIVSTAPPGSLASCAFPRCGPRCSHSAYPLSPGRDSIRRRYQSTPAWKASRSRCSLAAWIVARCAFDMRNGAKR